MRLTCLRCGHQVEVAPAPVSVTVNCTCGVEYTYPEVHNTGIRPNERAAERSRSRAFRAAGLVKNVGGFALGLAALGILFFPLGIAGAALGVYTLTMLRGPVGRYSGRRAAVGAIVLGSAVFGLGFTFTYSWMEARKVARLATLQSSVSEDLRALLRAERLYRAGRDTYGTLKELRFQPPHGQYTIYLAPDDVLPATRDKVTVTDPLPPELQPALAETAFTAVAVGNLDDDPDLDVWTVNDAGQIEHVHDDAAQAAAPTGG